jgi:hypothetical protein
VLTEFYKTGIWHLLVLLFSNALYIKSALSSKSWLNFGPLSAKSAKGHSHILCVIFLWYNFQNKVKLSIIRGFVVFFAYYGKTWVILANLMSQNIEVASTFSGNHLWFQCHRLKLYLYFSLFTKDLIGPTTLGIMTLCNKDSQLNIQLNDTKNKQ